MSSLNQHKRFWIVAALFTVGGLFAAAETIEWAADQTTAASSWARIVNVLFSWAPIISMVAVYHLCMWSGPAREVARVASDVHKGQVPLEELNKLSGVNGGLAPLVTVLKEILTDLKQQKAVIAKTNLELRHRIASKTESLERKIGSLQVQATRDALTGLFNRRGLDLELAKVVEQNTISGTDACVLMVDVDHFKGLNDTLGHAAGDELLKSIAQIIRSSIRGGDQAFRCGGDEFVVLLDGCHVKAGQGMADRIASLVEQLTRPMRVAIPPTLSIGTCAMQEMTEPTPEKLLKLADERLYAVKSTRPRTRRAG